MTIEIIDVDTGGRGRFSGGYGTLRPDNIKGKGGYGTLRPDNIEGKKS